MSDRSTHPGDHWSTDPSFWTLAASNLAVLAMAVAYDWSISSIMLVYWGHSVVIGVASLLRISLLDDFSTAGMVNNGERYDETPATKRSMIALFLFLYSFMHFVIVIMVLGLGDLDGRYASFSGAYGVAMLGFAISCFYPLPSVISADRNGKPHIGRLVWMPFLRVLPMYFTFFVAGLLPGSAVVVVAFMLLKSLADAIMYVVDRRYTMEPGGR